MSRATKRLAQANENLTEAIRMLEEAEYEYHSARRDVYEEENQHEPRHFNKHRENI